MAKEINGIQPVTASIPFTVTLIPLRVAVIHGRKADIIPSADATIVTNLCLLLFSLLTEPPALLVKLALLAELALPVVPDLGATGGVTAGAGFCHPQLLQNLPPAGISAPQLLQNLRGTEAPCVEDACGTAVACGADASA